VLNNLVTELMNTRARGLVGQTTVPFMNPRPGWCWFQLAGQGAAALDDRRTPLLASGRGATPTEVMRYLPAGRHVLHVSAGEGARPSLIVRAIPEIIYSELGYHRDMPMIGGYGPRDWGFLQRTGLLDQVHVILERNPRPENAAHLARWRQQGKKVLSYYCTTWIGQRHRVVTPDAVHGEWTGSRGMADPNYDGVMIDEFSTPRYREKFPAFIEAIMRMARDPKRRGKVAYPYCGRMYAGARSEAFLKAVVDAGWRWASENYLAEQPTEQAARDLIDRQLRGGLFCYQDVLPHCPKTMIMCFGFLTTPPESQNIRPDVDFRVFMDMQMRFVATDPSFFGLSGVMWYHSAFADKELMRWLPRLYRHYAIEGRSTRVTHDPYMLSHLRNPDFTDGLTGWTVQPAEPGGIRIERVPAYGYLQGRMVRKDVATPVLVTRRSAAGPNRFSQEIRKLVPGRLYSLKMFVTDYGEYRRGKSVKRAHGTRVQLADVEIVPGESFREVWPSGMAGHAFGPFNRKNNLYITYHVIVFRARKDRSRLVVSDWTDATTPGGPTGQELAFNFIEVQPFLER